MHRAARNKLHTEGSYGNTRLAETEYMGTNDDKVEHHVYLGSLGIGTQGAQGLEYGEYLKGSTAEHRE